MKSRVLALSVLAGLVCAVPAGAATIEVSTKKDEFGAGGSKKCSLREAIEAANSNSKFGGCSKGAGSDKVVLGSGTYKLSIEVDNATEDENAEGDLDVTSNLTIDGKGASKSVIDGNSQKLDERILNQLAGSLKLTDLTLRNGQETDDSARGGAVWNEGAAKLTIDNVRVINNYTYYSGGGIAVTAGGTLKLTDSLVAENSADDYGGGITSYDGGGKMEIRNTRIIGNEAEDGAAVIVGDGKLTLVHSTIANNTGVDYGGGIDLYGNGATIKNSTISGNRATGADYGGGIYDESNDGPVLIEGSTISDNFTGYGGGGIYAASNSWTIRNSTISRNQALTNDSSDGYGGAIYNDGAAMTLDNVTLTRNTAYDSAGIYADGGTTAIKNSIVARNRDYGDSVWVEDCYESSGDVISLGHNLIGDGSCGPIASDLTGDGTNQLFPGLDPLASNGGPTQTHALQPGSKAINHGQGCPKLDQRGHKRKGKCDIGAFER